MRRSELAKDGIEPICESAGMDVESIGSAVAPLIVMVDPATSSICSGGDAACEVEAGCNGFTTADVEKDEEVPAVSREEDASMDGSNR